LIKTLFNIQYLFAFENLEHGLIKHCCDDT